MLGEDHPSTLDNMGNLALTYKNQGQLKKAEELYLYVIETKTRVLGKDHPSTLTSKSNLVVTYYM